MLAIAALVAFVIGLVLDVANTNENFIGPLILIGLALIAAHLGFGHRLSGRM